MKNNYFIIAVLLIMGGCVAREKPQPLEVGGHQLPQESLSSQFEKETVHQEAEANPAAEQAELYAPSTYNLQTPNSQGLDALPTLLIPSPSGHKVVILPPPR